MNWFPSAMHHEQPEQCWYTRREGVVRGPFSAENISRYMVLGRIRLNDELSQDGENWSTAGRHASLLPPEMARLSAWDDYKQLAIAHMKADERKGERRCRNCSNHRGCHAELRKIPDRRSEDADADKLLNLYLLSGVMSSDEKRSDPGRLRPLLLIMLLVSLMFAWLNPIQQ